MAPEVAAAASWSVAGTVQWPGSSSWSVLDRSVAVEARLAGIMDSIWERLRSVLWLLQQQQHQKTASVVPDAAVTAPKSVSGAFCGARSSSCSAREHCRSVL